MLQECWDELKAAMIISYPGFEGLGEWEPARNICEGFYEWDNINTNQIDVCSASLSTSTLRILPCGGPARNSFAKNC